MTKTQQPNALRLANQYEIDGILQEHRSAKDFWCRQAAVELRHQHARIEELEAQLSTIGVAAAAPVVLPKPAAYMGTWWPDGLLVSHSVCGFTVEELKNSSPSSRFEPLYTEKQVRSLLASQARNKKGIEQ